MINNTPNQSNDKSIGINFLEELSDLFSIFHDGIIESWSGDASCLRLKIGCKYLAEMINPSNEYFFVDLIRITHLEFAPWWKDLEKQTILTDWNVIIACYLGIIEAKVTEKGIEIISDNYGDDHVGSELYSGGNLSLNCADFQLYDEQMNSITLQQLEDICERYWPNLGNRKQ
jgi:hypothetical protein